LKRTFTVLVGAGVLLLVPASRPNAQTTELVSQAGQLTKANDYPGAEKLYRQALAVTPDDPEILKRLGLLYQKQLKFEQAIEVFREIVKRAPLYPEVNLLLGISYYGLNQFEEAEKALRKELVADPRNRHAQYYLALALSASGHNVDAIQQLESLRAQNAQDPEVLYQLALYYKSVTERMEQELAKAGPDSPWIHAFRGQIMAENQRFDEALLEYKEVLRKNPQFPGIHFALGEVYWQRKDAAHAQEELRLALLDDPNQPLAHYYIGAMLTENKQYAEAIPHLEVAISTYPKLTQAYFLLGKCYAGTDQPQRALELYSKALEIDPNYKEVHFQLHDLYARLGDKQQSEAHFKRFEQLTKQDQDKDKRLLQESYERQAQAKSQN
jgi:tetratricopeptide (TPR) repeat protein